MIRRPLTEPEAKSLARRFGIPVPEGRMLTTPADIEPALAQLEPPLALKVVSLEVLHKSDAGGVHLDLTTAGDIDAAMRATAALPGVRGWLLEEMAEPGVELVIGGTRHPRFGPMVMAGLGGIFVEVLEDIALRICPIRRTDAEAMLRSLRGRALLEGARGRAPVAVDAIVDILLRVGGEGGLLMHRVPDSQEVIAELDLNPVIASAGGATAVDARIIMAADESVEPAREPVADLCPLLEPGSVAVVGASATATSPGNYFIRNMQRFGYRGRIWPVHPRAEAIESLPAVASLAELPQPVDYAYVTVGAGSCVDVLAKAAGKVRFAQVMAGGFSEGSGDTASEEALVAAARAGGARLLGPNCMGTHSPSGRLTYLSGVDPTPGHVAVLSQSGGLSQDALRRGSRRGILFRTMVSTGNSADLGPAELLPWLMDDPDTHVIGLYLEDVRRGRKLFELLDANRGRKPIALLIGGRTAQGGKAALSHTGALAGDARAWDALAAQLGLALADTLDEFLDVLLAMQMLTPRAGQPTREVVLLGNGGGTSVLGADAFARAGLDVSPFGPGTRAALDALGLPAGASTANPIDIPANVLAREDGAVARRIVDAAFAGANPDAFVIHVNVPVVLGYSHADILGQLISATLEARASRAATAHVLLVLRTDGEPEIDLRKTELQRNALAAGIPVFDELHEAARALAGLRAFESAAGVSDQGESPGEPRDRAR